MWAIISSSCGWSIGSPPLMVMTVVPRSASRSTRRSISAIGTGADTASYSLQYAQARLQRRIGTICASIGWSLERIERANIRASRSRRPTPRSRRRGTRQIFPQCRIPISVYAAARGSFREQPAPPVPRVAFLTDTFHEMNGAARTFREFAPFAGADTQPRRGRRLPPRDPVICECDRLCERFLAAGWGNSLPPCYRQSAYVFAT